MTQPPVPLRATSLNSWDPRSQPRVTRGPGRNTSPGGRVHQWHLSPDDPVDTRRGAELDFREDMRVPIVETRKPNQGAWQAMGGKRMLPPPRKDICILILRACDYVPSRGPGESRLQVELRL